MDVEAEEPKRVLRLGSANMHLTRNKSQDFIQIMEHWIRADICGVVETWIKDDGQEIREGLKDSEFQWFGKDRKGRRGGGVGFLVRKNIRVRALKSKSENLLWLVIQECLYVAVVYLIPQDKAEENDDTLQELQEDILRLRDKGEVVVTGDFNCRVGGLSNFIATDKSEDAEAQEIPRRSEDKMCNLRGRNLLDKLNAVDMVLMNGVNNLAQYTFQSTYEYLTSILLGCGNSNLTVQPPQTTLSSQSLDFSTIEFALTAEFFSGTSLLQI